MAGRRGGRRGGEYAAAFIRVMRLILVAFTLIGYAGWIVLTLVRYHAQELAPTGGPLWKVLAGWAVVGASQLVHQSSSAAALEGWHDDSVDSGSPFWAENLYFWANTRRGTPSDEQFLYTARLSFFSANATRVLPWFTFVLGGEEYSLPNDFAARTVQRIGRGAGARREAYAPGLGLLQFELQAPFERWRLRYDGVVTSSSTGRSVHARADFTVELGSRDVFHFRQHMDALAAARAMAGKEWGVAFFRGLGAQRQERYTSAARHVDGSLVLSHLATEGGGGEHQEDSDRCSEEVCDAATLSRDLPAPLSGAVPVAELRRGAVSFDGSRDHNFGVRNWRYIWRYVWLPPLRFERPLVIGQHSYTYMTGSFVEYGDMPVGGRSPLHLHNRFSNLVVGALVGIDDGTLTMAWSGATPMQELAPAWYAGEEAARGAALGERTLPAAMNFTIGLAREM